MQEWPELCLFTYLWCLAEVGASRTRDNIIRKYFEMGFSYHLILCFLVALHGIYISLSTLKRTLRRLNLRRRGLYSSLHYVGQCVLVSGVSAVSHICSLCIN